MRVNWRLRQRWTALGCVVVAAWGTQCSNSNADPVKGDSCPVGSEGCPCTQGGACDQPLQCLSNLCVNTGTGTGGSAGVGGASGAAGQNVAGATGQGGTANGGTAGVDSGAPPAKSCTANAECDAKQLCVFDPDKSGHCFDTSPKDCASVQPGNCINAMGFDYHPGIVEGDICSSSADCKALKGSLLGACADFAGLKKCVPLGQYWDDIGTLGCVLDPRFGVLDGCSRNHARLWVTFTAISLCSGDLPINGKCASKTAVLSPELEWTTACIEAHLENSASCILMTIDDKQGCFTQSGNPNAKMDVGAWMKAMKTYFPEATFQSVSGGSPSQGCGTDCDCGHCYYCETSGGKGVCRFGGEGPYGCYRGCD